MEKEYSNFLEIPSRENYLRIQKIVLANGLQLEALHTLIEKIKSQRFDAAVKLQDEMGATWLLSPSFHFWSAQLADHIGDADAVELERFQFQACIAGLSSTGAGTAESPFQVTYTSDVRDLLDFLGAQAKAQRLVNCPVGVCDVVESTDGRKWFFARPRLTKSRRLQLATYPNTTLAN